MRDGEASISITDLEFADDPLYQIAFIAGLNVLFDVMISRPPRTRIGSVSASGFVIELDWRPT